MIQKFVLHQSSKLKLDSSGPKIQRVKFMKTTIFRNFPPLSFTCCTKSGSAESQSVIGQHDAFLQQSSTKTTVLNNFWLFQRRTSLKFTETRACNNTRPFSAYNTHVLNIANSRFLDRKMSSGFHNRNKKDRRDSPSSSNRPRSNSKASSENQ